jgi:nitroimidazol reductase NimA-like FMN-containing flavoprotein (pyridoxamine 5'-phosphate oxidase superfamily)
MIEKMKALAKTKDICVLATVNDNQPHCSLMAYAVDENCREFYFTTSRTTKKFTNISKNPQVSLLIDSRENTPRSNAQALTVTGVCVPASEEDERRKISKILLEKHPHLKKILNMPDSEILIVSATSFLFLDGLTDAYFEKIG